MVSSKCSVCDSKKSRYEKNQEASRLISSLGTKSGLDEILILEYIVLKVKKLMK